MKREKEVIIIDCRSEAEYSGRIAHANHRGHVPTSINIDGSVTCKKVFKL
ncbi:rhodanese-like domain-containing protein [Candidatus Nitrosocosmicus sp. SS]|nr:hypothetical protein F1Z66_12890 [Candidatus Nitrosocosmicus sp. SS]KAF0868256.1 hypothetical protein E5N71_11325 [Candidatus Nitrosocosmicus sp. SS]